MELRQVEHFLAVAEERHFTRAARRVHLAQSSLSSSIRTLEAELGCRLLVRTARSVELTTSGQAFLPKAHEIVRAVEHARRTVTEVGALLTGTLRLGLIQCMTALDVPATLARFHAAHPGVKIRLRQGVSPDLIDEVRSGELDIAFGGVDSARAGGGVDIFELGREEMVLAVAENHALAGKTGLALSDLHAASFIDFRADSTLTAVVEAECTRAGFHRTVTCEVQNIEVLLDLVAQGLGVALLPRPVAEERAGQIAIARLTPAFSRTLAVIARREPREPAAAALLDMVLTKDATTA
ncbi:MAG TPA: LysR family transcriptional regulator [Amycolatopsis sp.]|jgi:DNA-binding transcriptional LysR family regulator|nr:LysR family transcriptional regulator [Amycolatopsis sp.]